MTQQYACQVRLLGEEESVQAIVQWMVKKGVLIPTGAAPMRNDPKGMRVYGVAAIPTVDGMTSDAVDGLLEAAVD